MRRSSLTAMLLLLIGLLVLPASGLAADKQLIFDEAGLLSPEEVQELNALANQLGAERQTDFIIITSSNTENKDVAMITNDFYDENLPGENAAILTMDMRNRQVDLGGFYLAEEYLDNSRLDKIRNGITPALSAGNYADAFREFLKESHRYMGYEPGFNPDNILFQTWFQVAVSLALGGLVVSVMVFRSGGRVTINRQTYEDSGSSGVLAHRDTYLRTTTTKTKIPRNNGGGGGGGGGGMTRGGHSRSGSRGSF
ncbi:TPM domain-containing protein [Paenibacillus daejeonensis]|uniref:TPM domain-containing protein n=1 Tax=Paenibacillus daejeonensis TaxID=135193 RepID=UPI0003759351|nr:TPM domain-containing protein [Paenibacillus daejeonensis]